MASYLREHATADDAIDAYLLGRVCMELGDWEAALPALERARRLDPSLRIVQHHIDEIRGRLQRVLLSHATVDAAIAALGVDVDAAAARRSILGFREDGAASVVAYAEGRLLLREGDAAGAIEAFAAAMAAAPEAPEPWLAWHALLVGRDGRAAADRAFAARIDELQPQAVFDVVPPAPTALTGTQAPAAGSDSVGAGAAAGGGPGGDPVGGQVGDRVAPDGRWTLRIAAVQPTDPRHRHTATLWQVRRLPDGDYDLAPAVEILTGPTTELVLPAGQLEGGVRYVWRAAVQVADRLLSPFSDERLLTVAPGGPKPVSLDLTPFAGNDVVANRGDRSEDAFDEPNRFSLLADGFDPRRGDAAAPAAGVRGLPVDGRLGEHRLLAFDGPNAVRLDRRDDLRLTVPPGSYSCVRGLVAAANGNAAVPVTAIYEDGPGVTWNWVVPDWFSTGTGQEFASSRRGTPRWRGMDRVGVDGVDERDAARLYECYLPTDPARRLVGLLVGASELRVSTGQTVPWLFALTAMTAGG